MSRRGGIQRCRAVPNIQTIHTLFWGCGGEIHTEKVLPQKSDPMEQKDLLGEDQEVVSGELGRPHRSGLQVVS